MCYLLLSIVLGRMQDRLAGTRCSGNTCAVQDSLSASAAFYYVGCIPTLSFFEPG